MSRTFTIVRSDCCNQTQIQQSFDSVDFSTSTNHELKPQLQFFRSRYKLQSSNEEHFISKCGDRMQVWDGCSSGTARSQIWDPKIQFLDLDGLSRFQPTVPVTFLHLRTPILILTLSAAIQMMCLLLMTIESNFVQRLF